MTHASLFSGIGGAEIAAAQMGWSNAFHCEINPFGALIAISIFLLVGAVILVIIIAIR